MLTVESLCGLRGGRLLFAGLDACVGPGEALHLVGANGSGKTTLLRMLAGLAPAAGGQVLWSGRPVARLGRQYWREIAWLGHRNGLKAERTALENLRDAALMQGRPADADSLRHALAQMGVAQLAELPVVQLSQGQQRRVALARIAASGARLWLLDEPTTALDSAGSALFDAMCDSHLRHGGMLVFANHHPLSGLRVRELALADYMDTTYLENAACSLAYAI